MYVILWDKVIQSPRVLCICLIILTFTFVITYAYLVKKKVTIILKILICLRCLTRSLTDVLMVICSSMTNFNGRGMTQL